MLHLHDTAKGEVVELAQRDPGRLSMYVCGPTVYDQPHLGHGRSVLVYDVLRRYLEWSGLQVDHVSNITDIDDRVIERAESEGRPAAEVATEQEALWWEAMDRLGAIRPTRAPRATDYVEPMVGAVTALAGGGHAYETSDGVYLEVATVPGYGLLAQQSLDSLRSGARVELGREKRSPLDFVLWKKAKPGEPSWPSPWGEGRPGWHTECVVMSLDLLGEGFDLHAGGLDLRFPHHENERAQALALGRPFARHWMHHAFVETAGEKMSKSLGNFTSLTDLLEGTDPRAYRLAVLQSHYRSPLVVTRETMADAERSLERLDTLARRFPAQGSETVPSPPDAGALSRFRARMDDDLDTPGAMAVVFDLVRSANAAGDGGDGATARRLAATVGELGSALGLSARVGGDEVDAVAAELVRRRDQAREGRDFAAADALRDELTGLGWVVEDGPGGTGLRRRPSP